MQLKQWLNLYNIVYEYIYNEQLIKITQLEDMHKKVFCVPLPKFDCLNFIQTSLVLLEQRVLLSKE